MLTAAHFGAAPHQMMHEPAAPRDPFVPFQSASRNWMTNDDSSDDEDNGRDRHDASADWSDDDDVDRDRNSSAQPDVDDWSDEDEDRDSGWADQFQQYLMEDAEREAERAQRRREQQLAEQAAAEAAAEEARRAEEANRLREPIREELGTITFRTKDGTMIAQLTASGCVVHDGARFPSLGKWLEHIFRRV